jgi:hypothetical protein
MPASFARFSELCSDEQRRVYTEKNSYNEGRLPAFLFLLIDLTYLIRVDTDRWLKLEFQEQVPNDNIVVQEVLLYGVHH